MLSAFFKVALIIMTINGFLFFVMGGTFTEQYQDQWSWLPSDLRTGQTITSASQVQPHGFTNLDSNNTIEESGSANPTVPNLFTLLNAGTFIFNVLFNILFGYFIWMPAMGIPFYLTLAIGIPLLFIQMLGLFYLLQFLIATLTAGFQLFR